MRIREQIMVIVLAVALILSGFYFIPKWLVPQASQVTYYCTNLKQKSIISRSAMMYPAIKDIEQLDNEERKLELKTGCSYVSIYAVQTMNCRDCGKDVELARKDKEIDKLNKELMQSKGGWK
jgi:transcription initiation factor IIE alpha subunit